MLLKYTKKSENTFCYPFIKFKDADGDILLDLEHSLDHGMTWQPRGHVSVTGGRATSDQNQLDDTQKQALRVSFQY